MKRLSICLFSLLFIWTGCDLSDNEVSGPLSFHKIYDTRLFGEDFRTIDIKETADEGFIILAAKETNEDNFSKAYLLKVDKNGEYEQHYEIEDPYVHPVGNLISIDQKFYFLVMNEQNLSTNLVVASASLQDVSIVDLNQSSRPLAFNVDVTSNLLVLGYDAANEITTFSRYSTDGNLMASQQYSIGAGDDVDIPILEHFSKTGKKLPFFCGQSPDGYFYFNGYYNYALSLVYDNFTGTPTGVIQGDQYKKVISAVLPTTILNFTLARYDEGINYYNASHDPNIIGNPVGSDIPGFEIKELIPDSPVVIKSATSTDGTRAIYLATTVSGQMVLMGYDQATGEQTGIKYLGYSSGYTAGNFTQTSDGGLAVCGTMFQAGRFARICMFKFDQATLDTLF